MVSRLPAERLQEIYAVLDLGAAIDAKTIAQEGTYQLIASTCSAEGAAPS
jgi:hypothetical protein